MKLYKNLCLLSTGNFKRQPKIAAVICLNPLNTELNPVRHLLALVGARHIVHVSWLRVKPL